MVWRPLNLTTQAGDLKIVVYKSYHFYAPMLLFGKKNLNMPFEFIQASFQWTRTQGKSIYSMKQRQTTSTSSIS